MQRANTEGSDILATRPNGQTGAPAFASRLAQRKTFHPRQESKENVGADKVANGASARPPSSGSSSDNRPASATHATRIPRPSPAQKSLSRPRNPLSLSEAYRMAEEEEAARGSPSPAPRTWRQNSESNENRMQNILSQGPLNFGGRRNSRRSPVPGRDDDTQSSTSSTNSKSRRSDASESDIDRKLVQYEEDRMRMEGVMGGRNGIFSKSKIGPKVAETGQELHRKTSINSLDEKSPSRGPLTWGNRGKSKPNWLTRIISSPGHLEPTEPARDVPIPSIERDSASSDASPAKSRPDTAPPPSRSPNKSFAWQADADFTAGDLQISNSPPVKNTNSQDSLRSRPRNTKLDEIKQLEVEAALKFPDEDADPEEISLRNDENEQGSTQNRAVGRTNTTLDEIRAREIETLSRRALATARLDEIRERNAEYRSPSPDVDRKPSRELLEEPNPAPHDERQERNEEKSSLGKQGKSIMNNPVTAIQRSPDDDMAKPDKNVTENGQGQATIRATTNPSKSGTHSRNDSRDLLRMLSRATSTSPSPSAEEQMLKIPKTAGNGAKGISRASEKRVEISGSKASEDTKPTVGFAGLRRIASNESASTKRSSMAQSDGDPVDRIEAEMKLFAPLDNQSERGSIRAPSPESDSDEEPGVDETPRAPRPDPVSQPTPKVTGAFVETPATTKTGKASDLAAELLKPEAQKPLSSVAVASFLRGRPSRIGRSDDTRSDSGRKETARSTSVSSLRRSRSVPRHKSPLFNSAKPPSVRDDLLAIQRLHQVEDSTLDDFSELLISHNVEPSEVEKILHIGPSGEESAILKDISEHQRELEVYERMSKSLKTGLLGIQTAKKGIERLEDKVSQSESLGQSLLAHNPTRPATVRTYVYIPVPRLYYREPKFKLSILGILLLVFASWLVAESTMCSYHCKPDYCEVGRDCNWSPEDPFFGYAIPVKLDQWVSGGQGRLLANKVGQAVNDLYADAWDFVTATDINKVDTQNLSAEQKVQHRRRLWKKGLIKPRKETPDQKAKLDAWRAARQARERARDAREMGYDVGDGYGDESMAADEKVSRWGWHK